MGRLFNFFSQLFFCPRLESASCVSGADQVEMGTRTDFTHEPAAENWQVLMNTFK